MRRAPFLLAVFVAASAFLAPAAHADSACATAWIDGTAVPYFSPGSVCVAYPYDVGCEWDSAGVSPDVAVHVVACFPQV